MRLLRMFLAMLVLVLAMPLVVSCSQGSYNLHIFAAAGAKAAIDDVCQRYEEQCDIEAIATYGGGGEVLSQMILDKSGDVYIAPEQSFMEWAVAEGAVDADTIRSVAYMSPVIAVQKDNPENISSLADLSKPGLQIAISRPETTLVGEYALEIFDKAGLTEAIEPNIATYAANPNTLLTMLIMGSVDAIITWHYYAYLNPDAIENVSIPPEQITGIAEMQIAVSAYTKNPETAQEYVDFVASDEGKAVFGKHSYIVDEEEVKQYQQ